MPKTLRKAPECLNCHTEINNNNFCHECGQINTNKQVPLKYFVHDFMGDYFTFDSKFFKSFIPLLRRPGFLTNQYNSGKRTSFILPLRLYLFTTVLFFFIISLNNQLNKKEEEARIVERSEIKALFDDYGDLATEETKLLMTLDFDRRYRLIEREGLAEYSFRDSVKSIIRKHSQPAPLALEEMTNDLFLNFRFTEKGSRKNRRDDLKRLTEHLQKYPAFAKVDSASQIIADFNGALRIRKTTITEEAVNVKRAGSFRLFNTPADSMEDGWLKDFALRGERLMGRGEEGEDRFWREMVNQIPKVLFVVMPLFALIMKLLYIRQGVYYINHLIFSLHAHTIIFLYLLLAILFPVWYVITFSVFGIWFHLYFSVRNVYRQSRIMSVIKLNSALFLYFFPLTGGFTLLTVLAVLNA